MNKIFIESAPLEAPVFFRNLFFPAQNKPRGQLSGIFCQSVFPVFLLDFM
jgi:hypothetical protein